LTASENAQDLSDADVSILDTSTEDSTAMDTSVEVDDSKVLDEDSSVVNQTEQEPILVPDESEEEMETSKDPLALEPEEINPLPTPEIPGPSRSTVSTPKVSPTGGEPKVIKKGDQVITSYVDEKTGKITAYEPGIKLEVSDYAGKWYPAKVVEVDVDENEILVHFEHWSSRFDEWIKMDSNRLRPSPNTNIIK